MSDITYTRTSVLRALDHVEQYNGAGRVPEAIRMLRHGPMTDNKKTDVFAWGVLFRPGSLWIGAHWGGHHKHLCVNLIPCVTVWFTWPGGDTP